MTRDRECPQGHLVNKSVGGRLSSPPSIELKLCLVALSAFVRYLGIKRWTVWTYPRPKCRVRSCRLLEIHGLVRCDVPLGIGLNSATSWHLTSPLCFLAHLEIQSIGSMVHLATSSAEFHFNLHNTSCHQRRWTTTKLRELAVSSETCLCQPKFMDRRVSSLATTFFCSPEDLLPETVRPVHDNDVQDPDPHRFASIVPSML
jgi:hypothetical protein